MNTVERLQKWYLSQCNGDWEHGYGVKIDTLDNPGWHISIDLVGTDLKLKSFTPVRTETTETDWITRKIEGDRFEGFCGPLNLDRTLEIFLQWVHDSRRKD